MSTNTGTDTTSVTEGFTDAEITVWEELGDLYIELPERKGAL